MGLNSLTLTVYWIKYVEINWKDIKDKYLSFPRLYLWYNGERWLQKLHWSSLQWNSVEVYKFSICVDKVGEDVTGTLSCFA